MVRIVRSLIRWLWDRQPRVIDYIMIAVIAAVLTAVIFAAASGGRQETIPPSQPMSSGPSTGTSSTPKAPVTTTSQSFYAPDGNISCSLQGEGAQCSVASADRTFVIPRGGGSAYTVSGLSVPLGAGSEAPFGTERSDGVIVCDIPPEDVPAGVTCRDTTSGHGFEASRVASRQAVY
jgi:hypothetical protein